MNAESLRRLAGLTAKQIVESVKKLTNVEITTSLKNKKKIIKEAIFAFDNYVPEEEGVEKQNIPEKVMPIKKKSPSSRPKFELGDIKKYGDRYYEKTIKGWRYASKSKRDDYAKRQSQEEE